MNKIEELAMNDLKETRAWKNKDYITIIDEYRSLLAHYGMVAMKGNAHQLQGKIGITRYMIFLWMGISVTQWKKIYLPSDIEIDFDPFCAKRSVNILIRKMGNEILKEHNGSSYRAGISTGICRMRILRWANRKTD